MRKSELNKLIDETNTKMLDEIEQMPSDIESLKVLLAKVLTYNKVILEKLDKYTG